MKLSLLRVPQLNMLKNAEHNQQGVVLLLFVVALFMVSFTFLLTVLNNNRANQAQDANVAEALNAAKQELIAFATLSTEHFGAAGAGPGHLFCPDTNNNGLSNSPCGANPLGRLPRTVTTLLGTMQVSSFGVGFDQTFWFAIDSSLRSNPATVFNSATVPALTIDGVGNYVAVLIAPGAGNNAQARPNNLVDNYLEAGNTASPSFVTFDNLAPANFTDRVLGIRRTEITTPVTARVAAEIKTLLDNYRGLSGSYPDDSSFDDPALLDFDTVMVGAPAWFAANNWLNQSTYVRLNTDSATITFNGCSITYTVAVNVTGVARSNNQC